MGLSNPPRIEFFEEGHRYLLDGKPVPGVSEIIAPAYDFDFADRAAMEVARDLGKKAHRAIELHEEGRLDMRNLAPELGGRVEQWERFKSDHGYLPEASEEKVASRRWQYCGTMDSRGIWLPVHGREERAGLVDVKTGKPYPPHKLQTAGYKIAAVETGILPASTLRATVYLEEDSYEVQFYDNPADEAAFSGLAMFAQWKRRYGK